MILLKANEIIVLISTILLILNIDRDLFIENVLQIVLLEPKHVTRTRIKRFLDEFKYFRVFIFAFNDDDDGDAELKKECFQLMKLLDWTLGSNSLILLYNVAANGSIHLDGMNDVDGIIRKLSERMRPDPDPNAITVLDEKTSINHFNLFDRTFGILDGMLKLPIIISIQAHAFDSGVLTSFDLNPRSKFIANYYYWALNATIIEVSAKMAKYQSFPPMIAPIIPEERKYYKELTPEYTIPL